LVAAWYRPASPPRAARDDDPGANHAGPPQGVSLRILTRKKQLCWLAIDRIVKEHFPTPVSMRAAGPGIPWRAPLRPCPPASRYQAARSRPGCFLTTARLGRWRQQSWPSITPARIILTVRGGESRPSSRFRHEKYYARLFPMVRGDVRKHSSRAVMRRKRSLPGNSSGRAACSPPRPPPGSWR
jgi:hypothetical protein